MEIKVKLTGNDIVLIDKFINDDPCDSCGSDTSSCCGCTKAKEFENDVGKAVKDNKLLYEIACDIKMTKKAFDKSSCLFAKMMENYEKIPNTLKYLVFPEYTNDYENLLRNVMDHEEILILNNI